MLGAGGGVRLGQREVRGGEHGRESIRRWHGACRVGCRMSRRSPTAPISPLDSARIRAGLTVESLAVAAGVPRAPVCFWLAGRTRPRHPCYLTRLGSVLGL